MNGISSTHNSLLRAVFTMLAAIVLFDVQGAMIKHMGGRYPVEQISFFRNLFGLVPSMLVLCMSVGWRPTLSTFKLARWRLGFGRGALLVCAQLSFYTSLVHMQLATATTLAFSGPLFITVLSIPMFGHSVGWWRAMAVLLGFAGVLLVMQPGSDTFTVFALLPISAAFFYALTSLSSRWFDESVPASLISLYGSAGAMCSALLLVSITGHWVVLDSLTDWLWFVAMGSVGGLAVLLMVTAYRMNDPSSLSPFEYFGIPSSFVLGWVIFDEKPFDTLFPGVFFIVSGGLLVLWRERQQRDKEFVKQ